MPAKKPKSSFTETISLLDAIVTRLEDSNTSLEESLVSFEEGVQLLRQAQGDLSYAEQRVQTLLDHPKPGNNDSSEDEPTE
ncbi:exodeoxyribonuclease VII small subunit [Parahaliea mediterranea]|uniref:Exodeoxyribonuclease 7 small subunit n=1 Tax=Parahaliea mediterranea TaxID=651086 RepID=A0A939DC80_9GAMM|nr:exodeoxyribonuclease VII small subunit [Parahaliea mediterranea]MBN7795486.1 exodeoxyribonuclease VII small subunit [Parahaliea mediterranea]